MPEIRIFESDAVRSRREDPVMRRGIALKTIESLGADATEAELCRRALKTIAGDGEEIPFALVYLIDRARHGAQLAAAAGIEEGTRWTPRWVDFEKTSAWPLDHVASTGESAGLDQLETRFGSRPSSLRSHAHRAFVLPVRGRSGEPVRAVLVVGLRDDEPATTTFLRDAADRIAVALSRARVRAAERSGRAHPSLPGL